jgi:Ca2+-binding EF-hand superfamily protein
MLSDRLLLLCADLESFERLCRRLFDGLDPSDSVVGLQRVTDKTLFSISEIAANPKMFADDTFEILSLNNTPEEQTPLASPPPEESAEHLIVLELGGEHDATLRFSDHDVETLEYIVEATGLRHQSLRDVLIAFQHNAMEGALISRGGFYSAIRELVPREQVHHADKKRITAFLTRMFDVFDRAEEGIAPADELLVGTALLVSGDKSSKLADCFTLLGASNGGKLTRRQMWRLQRAILSGLMAVSSGAESSKYDFRLLLDDIGLDVSRQVFGARPAEASMSFQDFADWFNTHGQEVLPWLELLDLHKWPMRSNRHETATVPATRAVLPPPAPPAHEAEEDPVVFMFQLGEAESLVAHSQDVERLRRILLLTKLHHFTPAEIAAEVMAESTRGRLPRDAFDSVARRLVDVSSLDKEDRRVAGAALAALFYAFDRYDKDEVDASHVATGLLSLAGGAKSAKLDVAWSLFEDEPGLGLNRSQAWECLSSLLTGLASLLSDHVYAAATDMRRTVEAGALETVTRLFSETRSRAEEDRVTFSDFAQWYNERGCAEGAVWLEMLDHSKWPAEPALPVDDRTRTRALSQLGVESSTDPVDADEDVVDDDNDDDDVEEEERAETVLYEFVISPAGDVLEITRSDCDFLHTIAATSGLSQRPCSELDLLERAASAGGSPLNGRIEFMAYVQAVEILLRGSGSSGEALRVARSALRSFFSWFGHPSPDAVHTAEIITGLCLFCGGSKSDKMMHSFHLLDERGMGGLDRLQLWRFFRAILLALSFVQAGTDPLSPTDRRAVVQRVAVDIASHVFSFASRKHGEERAEIVTFDDFAEWYNSTGFSSTQWIELLDLSKWASASPDAVSVARTRLALDGQRTGEAATASAPYIGRAAFLDHHRDDAEDEDEPPESPQFGDVDQEAMRRWSTFAFEFPLARRPDALRQSSSSLSVREGGLVDDRMMQLTLGDCAVVARLVQVGRFDSRDPDGLIDLVAAAKAPGRSSLSQDEFASLVVPKLLPHAITEAEFDQQAWLEGCLDRLFDFLDREATGRVVVAELGSTLTLFTMGSKTDKLSAIWSAFCGSPDGRLSKVQLWQMLRSILSIIVVAPLLEDSNFEGEVAAEIRDEVDLQALSVTEIILRDTNHVPASSSPSRGANAEVLSFDEFAIWYNRSGNRTLRWLELLDLTKWPSVPDDATPSVAQEEEEEAEATASEPKAPPGLAASIDLWPQGEGKVSGTVARLDISFEDIATLVKAVDSTQMGKRDPWEIGRYVLQNSSATGVMTRSAFTRCMNSLIRPEGIAEQRLVTVQQVFWRIWYAVDYAAEDAAPAAAVAAALMVLTGGSKSGKIAAALEVAAMAEGSRSGSSTDLGRSSSDSANTPTPVSRSAMAQVVRGFLQSLLGITHAGAHASARAVSHTGELVGNRVVSAIFKRAGSGRRASLIELGDWYNGEGFKTEGWIEMLDLRKWSPALAAHVADAPGDDSDEDGERDSLQDEHPEDDYEDEDEDEDDEEEEEEEDQQDEGPAPAAGEKKKERRDSSFKASASRDAVYGFRVTSGGNVIALSAHDVAGMSTIVRESQLDVAEPQEVLDAFSNLANEGGELDRTGFTEAIASFIDMDSLTPEVRAHVMQGLERLFDVFDEDASGSVDFAEFAAGFSLLCSGTKSDKLALAFRLFDLDGDGFISRAELESYLRAFVSALASFGGAGGSRMARLSADDAAFRRQVATEMAAELASRVLADADENDDGQISFEEFAQWYNNGGNKLVPWLELLSTSRLKGVADSEQPARAEEASAAPVEEPAATVVPNDEVLLRFSIARGIDDAEGHEINVTARTARTLRRITSLSSLRAVDPDMLHALFDSECDSDTNTLSREAFDKIIERLIPTSSTTEADRLSVKASLGGMFNAFDTNGDGSVDFAEFAAGFSLLCAGPKSEKLSLAFRLFDLNGDGLISRVELALYLRSFMLALLAIISGDSSPSEELRLAASREATRVASQVFEAADTDRDGAVSFEEFGAWYNSGGFNYLPWLELLDLSKWPLQDDREIAALDHEEEEEEGDQVESPTQVGEQAVYLLLPSSGPGPLDASQMVPVAVFAGRHTAFARRLAECSTLGSMDPPELWTLISRAHHDASSGGDEFLTQVSKVIARRAVEQSVDPGDRAWLSKAFPAVLTTLRMSGEESPSPAELTVSLLPLCRGSKSLKFAYAVSLLADKGDLSLSEVRVWMLLRCVLRGILAIRCASHGSDTDAAAVDEPAIKSGLVALAVRMTLEASADQPDELRPSNGASVVTFDDLGRWYNSGGCDVAQWLEFLDLSKWPPPPLERSAVAVSGHVTSSPGAKSTRTDDGRVVIVDEEEDVEGVTEDVEEDGLDDDVDEAAAVGGSSATMFAVELVPGGDTVSMGLSDSSPRSFTLSFADGAAVQRCIRAAALDRVSLSSAASAIDSVKDSEGGVTCDQFVSAVDTLAPWGDRGSLDSEDHGRRASLEVLSAIHGAVARSGGRADFAELIAAFSVLVAGSKSDKLSVLFELWGEHASDGECRVGRLELWCILRSLLRGLCALSSQSRNHRGREMRDVVDRVTQRFASIIVQEAGSDAVMEDAGDSLASDLDSVQLTFPQFGEWYNGGGYADLQWLELLDMRKWPDALSDGIEGGDDEARRVMDQEGDDSYYPDDDDMYDDDEDDDDGDDDDDQPRQPSEDMEVEDIEDESSPRGRPADEQTIISFSLVTAKDTPNPFPVHLRSTDLSDLITAADATGLSATAVSDLTSAVLAIQDESGKVHPEDVRRVIRQFADRAVVDPSDTRSRQARELRAAVYTSALLELLAASPDAHGKDATLDPAMTATAFALLCQGNKTSKISYLFDTYGGASVERHGIPKGELTRALTAILIAVMAASSALSTVPADSLYAHAAREAAFVVDQVSSADSEAVTFASFGRFYNDKGFELAPWIELYALSRWDASSVPS